MTGTSSDFGRELDSLADVITFGVAPALLAWTWGFRQLSPNLGNSYTSSAVRRYRQFPVSDGCASRLARFNISTIRSPRILDALARNILSGMPIPAGAV